MPFEEEILLTEQLTKYLNNLKGAKKKPGPLKHQIDTVCQFETLSIPTPKTAADIAGTLTALAEKKVHIFIRRSALC